ncbi:MAG TPA: ATP-grasp domain-containing protein [Candidatus Agrococcus pullicola]|uniref:biotin carboxylase n=1 Tax=Candidatus Agrococcus pullicola TaxID=2838429 RepID=A0A9D1YWI5_9MICO|nr:ATP-grasp domain-containing protein [Candidatus Agrococcus pullicola]
MFKRILIANRGEIACRIIRTCRRLGIESVAVYSDADVGAMHVRRADDAVRLGPAPAQTSYLDVGRLLAAAKESGADAIHPGYGFLSESPAFAQSVADAGLGWIGPSPHAISAMGDKAESKSMVAAAGVPIASGVTLPLMSATDALPHAVELGYPIMVKPSGGGGGIGMGIATNDAEFETVWTTAVNRSRSLFAESSILLERFTTRARHVEVQVMGLNDGRVLAVGERDCSVQRRHQKLVEESPSPGLPAHVRAEMVAAAITVASEIDYRGAGTVEFLLDRDSGEFSFLEMNTRLQVEHPVTELVFSVDLVEAQIRIAAGEDWPGFDPDALASRGHAFEFRVYAEDPDTCRPGPGTISEWIEPQGDVRVDSGYAAGDVVTHFYDPLLAKVCVWGSTREKALDKAETALADFVIEGPKQNLPLLRRLLHSAAFRAGDYGTTLLSELNDATLSSL